MLTDKMKQEINETDTKLLEGTSKSAIQVPVIPVWVPYKTLNNITESLDRKHSLFYCQVPVHMM